MEAPRLIYGDGWYGKERDGLSSFRWMKKQACFFLRDHQTSSYIRFIAGHSFSDQKPPLLEIFINGQKKDEKEIEAPFCSYAFLVEEKGDIQCEFRLNRTYRVPADPRELGIMVRSIDVFPIRPGEILLDGWYTEESHTPDQGCWMKQEARCFFTRHKERKFPILIIRAGHPFLGTENPGLAIFIEGDKRGQREILTGENSYLFPLGALPEEFILELKLNKLFDPKVTSDQRKLGVFVKNIEIIDLEEEDLIYGEGWCEREYDEFFPFRWMTKEARILLPIRQFEKHKYISFFAFSEYANFSQILTVSLEEENLCEIPLLYNWNHYSLALHPSPLKKGQKSDARKDRKKTFRELVFSLNKSIPEQYHKTDRRELGVRFGKLKLNNDNQAHQNFLFFHQNALLNHKEMVESKTVLASYPLNLGIDLYGKCNIKPPCVYCLWDWMKEEEGPYVDKVVDDKTLQDYGSFFRAARLLINCSIGEPLLHPRFKEILEFCKRHNKLMEISTNGQAFTPRTIKALVGRPIYLYVSLDAASKETYAKIRNDRWDMIIPNLILLNQERKKKGNLPKIHMVFMPMRVNKDELEDYFRLCEKIEADAFILRPLLYLDNPKIEEDRGGYHFDYKKELLSQKELEEIFQRCEELSKEYKIALANQFSFGLEREKELRRGSSSLPELPHF